MRVTSVLLAVLVVLACALGAMAAEPAAAAAAQTQTQTQPQTQPATQPAAQAQPAAAAPANPEDKGLHVHVAAASHNEAHTDSLLNVERKFGQLHSRVMKRLDKLMSRVERYGTAPVITSIHKLKAEQPTELEEAQQIEDDQRKIAQEKRAQAKAKAAASNNNNALQPVAAKSLLESHSTTTDCPTCRPATKQSLPVVLNPLNLNVQDAALNQEQHKKIDYLIKDNLSISEKDLSDAKYAEKQAGYHLERLQDFKEKHAKQKLVRSD